MGKFKPGTSGNPRGRPRGIFDRRALLRAKLEASAPEIVQAVVTAALAGDMTACKVLLDKIIPNVKQGDLPVNLGVAGSDPGIILDATISAMVAGRVAPSQAERITSTLLNQIRVREFAELEQRLQHLEQTAGRDE